MKRPKSASDWIWLGLFVAVAAGVVYVMGWILVP